jgi:hypothetical protein
MLIKAFALDEGVGRSVGGVYEVNVTGVAAWSVNGEDDEGLFENLGSAVDGALLEKDELPGASLEWRSFAEEKRCAAREYDEIFVAGGVIVRPNWMVDAKDAGAGVKLVGQASVDQHGAGAVWKTFGDLLKIEDASVSGGSIVLRHKYLCELDDADGLKQQGFNLR